MQIQSRTGEQQPGVRERRTGEPPVPYTLREILSDMQWHGLRQVESFGWRLAFVRRPLFQEPQVVVVNSDNTRYAVLDEEGTLDTGSPLEIRH